MIFPRRIFIHVVSVHLLLLNCNASFGQELNGFWIGKIATNMFLKYHQRVQVVDDKVYLYDLHAIVDSLTKNGENVIENSNGSYRGRLKYLDNGNLLVEHLYNSSSKKRGVELFKQELTTLKCSTNTISLLENKESKFYVVITEDDTHYLTSDVASIKRIHEFQEFGISKNGDTYFIHLIHEDWSNDMAPISEIRDDSLLVFDWQDEATVKLVLGKID